MNKIELIAEISNAAQVSKKDADMIVNELFAQMTKALAEGEKVIISGFGCFETKRRAPRIGNNPRTGEKVAIAETTALSFRPGKALKEAINK